MVCRAYNTTVWQQCLDDEMQYYYCLVAVIVVVVVVVLVVVVVVVNAALIVVVTESCRYAEPTTMWPTTPSATAT